jgi:hypothetical protein
MVILVRTLMVDYFSKDAHGGLFKKECPWRIDFVRPIMGYFLKKAFDGGSY